MSALPTPSKRPAVLGIELDGDGAHPAAWRFAAHQPGSLLNGNRIRETVQAADIAGFHLATFRDSRTTDAAAAGIAGRIDAVQRAAFAAPITRSIGLVPEAGVLYTEPFHVATQLASLDYASHGRAGWLLSTENSTQEARSVGYEAVTDGDVVAEAGDVVESSRRLWDSWEDDAVIRDEGTGRYLDAGKLHYVDFEGSRFSVKGPSIIPRPLQGQVPVFAAAALFPVVEADVALVSAETPEALAAAVTAARNAGAPRTLVDLDVVLDARGRRAADRLAELDAHQQWAGNARYVGNTAGLVELLAALFQVSDGVRINPAVLDTELPELAAAVLPELRLAGLLAAPAPGSTLRESFGLPRPANRYAAAAAL